jgi:FkbM family methyltransferase
MRLSPRLRRLAEKLSRGVVLRRRLPAEFQRLPILVTPEAGLRHWLGPSRVDPHLFRMAGELVEPGAVVWDVGANVGLFAFSAAARAGVTGFVLAIEPDIWLADLMNRSSRRIAERNFKAAPVKVLCASVSREPGIAELEIAERARASNHLGGLSGSTQTGGHRYLQPTVSVSLDSLLNSFPAPHVLKIDVESHEAEVLAGAARLLESARPVIWAEVDPSNAAAVSELLYRNRYQILGAATVPHPAIKRAWWNTLAVPEEKIARLRVEGMSHLQRQAAS